MLIDIGCGTGLLTHDLPRITPSTHSVNKVSIEDYAGGPWVG